MVEADVEICESNGVGETITHNITNINYSNVDEPNSDPSAAGRAIPIGENSYEKWIRLHVTNIQDANAIDNIQIWKSAGAYVTGETIQTNLKTSAYSAETYAQPSKTTYTDQAMPTADPTQANLGIAGSLSGQLTAAGFSDYWRSQTQSTGSTPAGNGNQKTYTIQYDEQ